MKYAIQEDLEEILLRLDEAEGKLASLQDFIDSLCRQEGLVECRSNDLMSMQAAIERIVARVGSKGRRTVTAAKVAEQRTSG